MDDRAENLGSSPSASDEQGLAEEGAEVQVINEGQEGDAKLLLKTEKLAATKADLKAEAEAKGIDVKSADTKEVIAEAIIETDYGPHFAGFWHGIPNYKCPNCEFHVLGEVDNPQRGENEIEFHMVDRHSPPPSLHPTIYGPDGKPLS